MSAWPAIKTARDLVAERVIPCSEDYLRALAKQHGVGRKLGRTYVFTPEDVQTLIEKLPCPSSSANDTGRPAGTSAVPSGASVLTKALDFASRKERRPKPSSSSAQRKCYTNPSTVIALPARSQTPR